MQKNKSKVFSTAIVEKRNVLNEIRKNSMSLQELRFFSIYLATINAYDISTRLVRFPLSDFKKIMGIGDDMNISHFKLCVRKLLQQIVEVPNESGYGYTAFQLFKKCNVDKVEYVEWYVEIDAHDEALPLMFEFKNRYFTYELWNALRLKSANQVRMYEILKQYEKIGKREITVSELRELLGIAPNEYSNRWDNFKMYVLDSCQQALKENTDICFTYERGKTGKGGKWLSIIFHIFKNTEHKDPLSLNEFIHIQEVNIDSEISDVFQNQLTKLQINELITLSQQLYPDFSMKQIISLLKSCWYRLLCYAEREPIQNKCHYLATMIRNESKQSEKKKRESDDEKRINEIAEKYSIFL